MRQRVPSPQISDNKSSRQALLTCHMIAAVILLDWSFASGTNLAVVGNPSFRCIDLTRLRCEPLSVLLASLILMPFFVAHRATLEMTGLASQDLFSPSAVIVDLAVVAFPIEAPLESWHL